MENSNKYSYYSSTSFYVLVLKYFSYSSTRTVLEHFLKILVPEGWVINSITMVLIRPLFSSDEGSEKIFEPS